MEKIIRPRAGKKTKAKKRSVNAEGEELVSARLRLIYRFPVGGSNDNQHFHQLAAGSRTLVRRKVAKKLAKIFPLAIFLDDDDVVFNHEFFYNTPNRLLELAPNEGGLENYLRLIQIADFKPNHHLELVMDSSQGQAVGYIQRDK